MRALSCLSLAVLFLANGAPIYAQRSESVVEVLEGEPLNVECALRVEQRAEWKLAGAAPPPDMSAAGAAGAEAEAEAVTVSASPPEPSVLLTLYKFDIGPAFTLNCSLKHVSDGIQYQWKKNGTEVEKLKDLKDRVEIDKLGALTVKDRTSEDDFGNYTCGVLGAGDVTGWQVQARVHVKLPRDVNVVEGQTLKLHCKLTGKPYPPVRWTYSNGTIENATDVFEVLGDRVKLTTSDQGVEGGDLVVESVTREDAGRYSCGVHEGALSSTTVRVKDMYAALWPFLGICAEVFVLCAIILVYEKRRTKPEHDDSDTENHDQKKS